MQRLFYFVTSILRFSSKSVVANEMFFSIEKPIQRKHLGAFDGGNYFSPILMFIRMVWHLLLEYVGLNVWYLWQKCDLDFSRLAGSYCGRKFARHKVVKMH
jgi:hypothetical protein